MILKTYLSFRTNPFLSVFLIFILLIGYLFIQINNGRFSLYDFEVYYRAAERLAIGQNLYQIPEDGHYIFKYSPVSAFYFIPLSWLPLTSAKIIYWLMSSLAVSYVLVLIYRIGITGNTIIRPGRQNLLFIISFLCLGAFFELELHLGQVNIFIMLLFVLSAFLSMKSRPLLSGLLLSVSLFLKPFGLILLIYYLYRMKFSELIYCLVFSIVLFWLPLLFYSSFEMFIEQYGLWFHEILSEMNNKQDLLALRNHTLFSILARYTPLRWIEWTATTTLIYQFVIVVILGGLLLRLRIIARDNKSLFPFELGLILCLIPLLAFTNRNLYMFNGLAMALLLIRFGSLHWIYKLLFIVGVLISSFNIIEIWGNTITYKLEDFSFICLGTTIIWIVLYMSTIQITEESIQEV